MGRVRRSVSVDAEILEDAERRIRDETGRVVLGDPVVDRALRVYATLENPEDLLGDTDDLTPTGPGSHPR